jgi:transcriptional regulator with XRE-family HTH domain
VAKRTDSQSSLVERVTKRVAEVRREKGLTQAELAARLRIAVRTFQDIEAGQNLTLHTIERIAAALGVEPEELLVGARKSKQRTRS